MTLAILAFLLTAAADVVWVQWHRATAEGRAVRAAWWSVGIFVCGSAFTLAVAERDVVAFLSGLAGAWVGTYFAVNGR